MENNPLNPDDQAETSDKKDSKKKKKASHLGSFLVTPKPSEKPDEKAKESAFEEVFGPSKKEKNPSDKPESKEAEGQLTELSEDEKLFIEREYVQAYKSEAIDSAESPEEIAAEAAVEDFHELIEEGVDSEDALTTTLEKLDEQAHEIQEEQEVHQQKQNVISRHVSRLSEFIMPDRESIEDTDDQVTSSIKFDFLSHPAEPARNVFSQEDKGEKYIADKKEAAKKTESPAGTAVLGGIIGYLVGRRQNRISGEKKLKTVQEKLQREVVNLGWQLSAKEETIRRAARRNTYLAMQQENHGVNNEASNSRKSSEHLGKVIIASEELIYSREVKEGAVKSKPEAPKITKHVENLNRTELLEISRKIIVDGTSLRQIYESHLIGERGLRRLVKEHMRGGNLKKALRRELMQREIDFERDPIMRDQDIHRIEQVESKSIDSLIEKAAVSISADSGSALSFEKRPQIKIEVQDSKKNNLGTLDILLTSVIAILSAAVILLLLRNY